jgi:hypothetical protein
MSAEPKAAALDEIDDDQPGGYFLSFPRRFCFVAGTHIATLRGEMPVDQLREGDHIRAKKGSFHTVKDVMIVDYDDLPPEVQAQIGLYPVKRGAVEEGLPRRDVYISAGQQFHLSRRLEIAHAVRMTVRKEGAALRGFRFVLFACPGLPMIRAEGVWTTLTPIERLFPMPGAGGEEGDPAETPDTAAEAPGPRARSRRPRSVIFTPAHHAIEPAPAAMDLPREPAIPVRRISEPAALARRISMPAGPLLRAPEPVTLPRPVSQPVDAVAAPALLSPRPAAPEGPRRQGRRPPTRFLRTPLTIPDVTDQTPEA